MRIVSEWSEYDQEIKRIYNQFLEEKERASIDSIQTTDRKHTGKLFWTIACQCYFSNHFSAFEKQLDDAENRKENF